MMVAHTGHIKKDGKC